MRVCASMSIHFEEAREGGRGTDTELDADSERDLDADIALEGQRGGGGGTIYGLPPPNVATVALSLRPVISWRNIHRGSSNGIVTASIGAAGFVLS